MQMRKRAVPQRVLLEDWGGNRPPYWKAARGKVLPGYAAASSPKQLPLFNVNYSILAK